jgi:hypothetical protein
MNLFSYRFERSLVGLRELVSVLPVPSRCKVPEPTAAKFGTGRCWFTNVALETTRIVAIKERHIYDFRCVLWIA